jgi:hypothetical protein
MAANTLPAVVAHGAARLPSVQVDDYNVELQDDEGFIGDRASKSAFRDIVSHWRTVLQNAGVDPLGDEDTHALSKKALDECLTRGDPKTAGIAQGVIEEFSQEFAVVSPLCAHSHQTWHSLALTGRPAYRPASCVTQTAPRSCAPGTLRLA